MTGPAGASRLNSLRPLLSDRCMHSAPRPVGTRVDRPSRMPAVPNGSRRLLSRSAPLLSRRSKVKARHSKANAGKTLNWGQFVASGDRCSHGLKALGAKGQAILGKFLPNVIGRPASPSMGAKSGLQVINHGSLGLPLPSPPPTGAPAAIVGMVQRRLSRKANALTAAR